MPQNEVALRIVSKSTGAITTQDVLLARTTAAELNAKCVILCFGNLRENSSIIETGMACCLLLYTSACKLTSFLSLSLSLSLSRLSV